MQWCDLEKLETIKTIQQMTKVMNTTILFLKLIVVVVIANHEA